MSISLGNLKMIELKNKFAIGCLVQWYEVEIIDEYIQSVAQSLENIDNKENVVIDFHITFNQDLEKINDNEASLDEIKDRFFDSFKNHLTSYNIIYKLSEKDIYTIADYRREFNDKYCETADILMWGETDAIIPKQTFEILDNLHEQVKDSTPKYIATFSICKMWDKSWEVLEHPEFTVKPFIENDYDNWWSLKYTMNIDEMNSFNNKVNELDVQVLNNFKFNGCGLVFSSDIVKCGANIPKSVFFVHEDTSFQNIMTKLYGNTIPQYVIKNILIIHNRNHPKKRMYIKGESGETMNMKRRSNEWYIEANKMSEFNAYNFLNQNKMYSWEDVLDV